MNAKELIRAGKLEEARKLLIQEVKASPSDAGIRTLLFQVLVFLGEFDKAGRHLDAIAVQNPKSETGVEVYKNLLQAEIERLEVFSLKRRPSFLPETPAYTELYFDFLAKLDGNKTEQAEKTLAAITAELPIIKGAINGNRFEKFNDTDSFLSLFLEAIVHERYVWLPLTSLREIVVETPPKTLFDTLWIPATITSWDGFSARCFLPVLYHGSYEHKDERVRLGRMTDWSSIGGSFYKGAGQHVYQAGKEDISILEIQKIVFSPNDTVEN